MIAPAHGSGGVVGEEGAAGIRPVAKLRVPRDAGGLLHHGLQVLQRDLHAVRRLDPSGPPEGGGDERRVETQTGGGSLRVGQHHVGSGQDLVQVAEGEVHEFDDAGPLLLPQHIEGDEDGVGAGVLRLAAQCRAVAEAGHLLDPDTHV